MDITPQEKTAGASFWEYLYRNVRDRLAIRLVNMSMLLIIIMLAGFFYFLNKSSIDQPQKITAAKDIFTMLLPVIGTWMGTVIAFYFSRENFQAAAQQAKELAKATTQEAIADDTAALKVMKPLSDKDVVKYTFATENGAEIFRQLNLKTGILDKYLSSPTINRLPVLDAQKKILYVIHQSLITNFIVSKNGTDIPLTMGSLLDSDAENKCITRFATASIDAPLSEIKQKLDKDPMCQDVFITVDGTPNTQAVGWITNVRMEEFVTVK